MPKGGLKPYSFIHSVIHSFIHSFIHSLIVQSANVGKIYPGRHNILIRPWQMYLYLVRIVKCIKKVGVKMHRNSCYRYRVVKASDHCQSCLCLHKWPFSVSCAVLYGHSLSPLLVYSGLLLNNHSRYHSNDVTQITLPTLGLILITPPEHGGQLQCFY